MLSAVKRLLVHDDGQDLIEYALLAAFIALAAVAAMTQLGTAINNIYTRILQYGGQRRQLGRLVVAILADVRLIVGGNQLPRVLTDQLGIDVENVCPEYEATMPTPRQTVACLFACFDHAATVSSRQRARAESLQRLSFGARSAAMRAGRRQGAERWQSIGVHPLSLKGVPSAWCE